MLTLYLDESGDHGCRAGDGQYPVFVLGGVLIAHKADVQALTLGMIDLKRRVFGCDSVILHAADISRNRNGFEAMKAPAFRGEFYEQLNAYMDAGPFKVVACAVRKNTSASAVMTGSPDLYLKALGVLLSLFRAEVREAGATNRGLIVAERRSVRLDRQLEQAWGELHAQGSRELVTSSTDVLSIALELRSKAENLMGLQLADLVVGPIARHVIGKVPRKDFEIIHRKFRRGPEGLIEGHGLVVLE